MPKTIHTPRDELICGKLDRALELLQGIERGDKGIVDLAFTLHAIRHDAERMEAKLASRKEEVSSLRETLRQVDHTLSVHGHVDCDTPLHERVSEIIS